MSWERSYSASVRDKARTTGGLWGGQGGGLKEGLNGPPRLLLLMKKAMSSLPQLAARQVAPLPMNKILPPFIRAVTRRRRVRLLLTTQGSLGFPIDIGLRGSQVSNARPGPPDLLPGHFFLNLPEASQLLGMTGSGLVPRLRRSDSLGDRFPSPSGLG
jgi:hypothetical protein